MQTPPNNKVATSPANKGTIYVTSDEGLETTVHQCKCRYMVRVPVRGETRCPHCRRRLAWKSTEQLRRLNVNVKEPASDS